jgi:flagellin-like hook-associated protein FlgL
VRHAPDDQHEHHVAELAAAPEHDPVVAVDLDGTALLRPSRQQRQGRRRRPGDRRPDERADPRHQCRDPQLSAEITRIATQTKFNGSAIVDTGAGPQTFQVGANNGDTLTITTAAVTTVTGNLTTADNASTALAAIDAKLDVITTDRATYGAALNRFGFAISNLSITGENQSAARGRIMDADFAAETANLSRAQILQQAGTAMVAQANQLPQSVLALLRN